MKDIPNIQWLSLGVVATLAICYGMPLPAFYYVVPGVLIAWFFLMFNNPKTEKDRYDITLAFPFVAIFWPAIFLAMLLNPPWKEPDWRNRNRPKKDPTPQVETKPTPETDTRSDERSG